MVPRMIRVVTQPLRSSPTEIPFLRYILREPSHLSPALVYPIARPGNANLFFSARLGFIWCVSPLSFRTLPPLRGRPLFPPIVSSSSSSFSSSLVPCRSFAATILSYVISLALTLSHSFLHFALPFPLSSLTVAHPLRLPHFHRAHPPPPPFSTRQHRRHRHRRGQYNRRHATLPSRRRSPRTGSLFVIVAYSIYCLRRFVRRRGCPGGVGRY